MRGPITSYMGLLGNSSIRLYDDRQPMVRELREYAVRSARAVESLLRLNEWAPLPVRWSGGSPISSPSRRWSTSSAGRLVFPANVDGETIDISRAVEVVVPAHFDLLSSRRVGNIVPGRRALRIADKGWRGTYIKGARALQFEVEKAGGSLRRFGCRLVNSGG